MEEIFKHKNTYITKLASGEVNYSVPIIQNVHKITETYGIDVCLQKILRAAEKAERELLSIKTIVKQQISARSQITIF